jgi:tRNA1(Val) A37 N6-methylase TrmN6
MERIEDLNLNGLKIYQDSNLYCFTSDAVLLSKFAHVKKGDVVADFCSGSGIVGLHLYGLNQDLVKSVTFFEMQTPLYELSVKSIEENDLYEKFTAVNTRLQDLGTAYAGKFSLITCNPPYMAKDRGFVDEKDFIAVCRTEVALSLEELVKAISTALKFGGRVNLVHRADRLVEVITTLKAHGIEPKRLQFVSGGKKEPYLFLMEGVKGGKSGITIHNTITN